MFPFGRTEKGRIRHEPATQTTDAPPRSKSYRPIHDCYCEPGI
jgi:hypothetical protein